MTVLGKILVFLNLVASIAVAAFIVLVFVSRTNWAAGYNEYKSRYEASEAASRTQQESAQTRQVESDKRIKDLEQQIAKLQTDVGLERARAKTKDDEALAARQLATGENAAKVALEADVQRLKEENTKLDQTNKDKNETIVKLTKEKNELRDEKVQAAIETNRHKVRVEQLASHLQDLTRENDRLRKGGGVPDSSAIARENPPPASVEGLVKQTDPSGLVTISIGSDAGLLRGHTLDVYRLSPNPEYLGQLRLTDVRPNEAVGSVLRRSKAPVKLGDRVGTLNTKG